MIDVWWFTEHKNFGDELNKYLIEKISNDKVQLIEDPNTPKHFCIGSILHLADEKCTVWGSGFIAPGHNTKGLPQILAVRGPKTREQLLKNGQACPEVYGDPALLLPKIYNPPVNKKYKIGIIPHYIDKNNAWIKGIWNYPEIKIIDIQGGIEDTIKAILSCEMIFSSSLHGVIVGDAYGIPSHWIKFNDRLGDFKFEDYLLSVGRATEPIIITDKTSIHDFEALEKYEINIDLDKLYACCPFKKQEIKLSILICTLPSRVRSLVRLLYGLEKQIGNLPVEVLFLGDNKKMSVGEKRNKLLSMATGKYVTFIDDDDRISDDYVESILSVAHINSDVITFDVEISENGSEYKKVKYDMQFECDKNFQNHYERIPNHLMAVKREFTLQAGFPETSFAEDAEYAKRLKPLLATQQSIDKTLYYYDFDEKTSETRD